MAGAGRARGGCRLACIKQLETTLMFKKHSSHALRAAVCAALAALSCALPAAAQQKSCLLYTSDAADE